jgi:hypothetical protein
MQDTRFPLPFELGALFAFLGSVFHFIIVGRLLRAGVKVKIFFVMPREQLNIYRSYRFMGMREKWPMWSLYGLYVTFAGLVIAWIAGVATFRK